MSAKINNVSKKKCWGKDDWVMYIELKKTPALPSHAESKYAMEYLLKLSDH